MLLTLQTTRYRGLPVTQPLSIVVGEHGATIGRNPGNDLVLPDPDRFVSGQHAVIRFQDGAFFLSDTSTNGTILNHAPSPIGRTTPVRLATGDELSIGEYELQVTVAAEAALGRPAAPGSEIALEGEAAPDPLQLLGGAHHGARLTSPEYGIPGPPPPPRPAVAETPLEPTGPHAVIPEDFDLLAPTPQEPGMGRSASEPDHIPAEQQQFRPPQAIPDDWDLIGEQAVPPPAEPAREPPAAAEPPPGTPWEAEPEAAPPHPPVWTPGAEGPAPQPPAEAPAETPWEPPPEPAAPPEDAWAPSPPPIEPEAPLAPPLRPAPARPSTPPPPAAPPTPAEAEALAAFISGLGLEPVQIRRESIPAVMVTFGRIVREMTDGLIKVLSARSQFKHELRLEMTTVRPVENNPLKFSVDVDEALHHLLLPRAKGYLPPLEAVHEAFDDIQAHEMAIMAGLHAALAAMLGRFDPKQLEDNFKQRSVLDNLLPIARKAKYWDIFTEIYQDIAKDAAEGFLQLFSDEFTRAYEEQVQKLKAARIRQRR